MLSTCISPEEYTKLKEQVRPQELVNIPFKQVELLLTQIFTKPTNTATELYISHKMTQQLGQSMRSYILVDQLKEQATKCKFGSFENEALKDQLVLRVIDNDFCKRLLQDDDLNFEKATNLALQFESQINKYIISS